MNWLSKMVLLLKSTAGAVNPDMYTFFRDFLFFSRCYNREKKREERRAEEKEKK